MPWSASGIVMVVMARNSFGRLRAIVAARGQGYDPAFGLGARGAAACQGKTSSTTEKASSGGHVVLEQPWQLAAQLVDLHALLPVEQIAILLLRVVLGWLIQPVGCFL